jgi:hypothetical protein
MISIGLQAGEPDDAFGWPKSHLYKLFEKHCSSTYCPAIKEFALVLRVCGSIWDFGPEAIERIRRRRADRCITVDIVVPVTRWHGKTEQQIKEYLAVQVRRALELCVARLKKDKEKLDDSAMFKDVDAAIVEFLYTQTPHHPTK